MQEPAARALESLLEPLAPLLPELVLVGGAAIPLWIDTPGSPPPRPTNDTDVIVAARSRVHYHQIGERLRELSFSEVGDSPVICRWRHTPSGALYDVMPLDADILGFSNRWYEEAFATAVEMSLPESTKVAVATPAHLVATKLLAFADRGNGDHLGSHDMYDIVALLDGCRGLLNELRDAPDGVRTWIAAEFARMVDTGAANDAVLNYLPYDSPPGADEILLDRMRRIAAFHGRA